MAREASTAGIMVTTSCRSDIFAYPHFFNWNFNELNRYFNKLAGAPAPCEHPIMPRPRGEPRQRCRKSPAVAAPRRIGFVLPKSSYPDLGAEVTVGLLLVFTAMARAASNSRMADLRRERARRSYRLCSLQSAVHGEGPQNSPLPSCARCWWQQCR